MKCGIVGLPTVGKSTIFNLLTQGHAEVRKFGGGGGDEPNIGGTAVPDERLDFLADLYHPKKKTPATVEFVDVAGMVPGKAKEEGFSPTLLGALRNVDALLHVVRCFHAADIPHSEGSVDPARDAELVDLEFIMADLGVMEKRIERLTSDIRKGAANKLQAEKEKALLERLKAGLEAEVPIRSQELHPEEEQMIRGYTFLSQKPLILVANIDEGAIGDEDPASALSAYAERRGLSVLSLCGSVEMDLTQLEAEEAALFMADLGITAPARDRLIQESYRVLRLISFFTVGEDECRAWTITRGDHAVTAADKIHSDIARGFIRAEVVAYDMLRTEGSWHAAKEHGHLRLEGKEYLMQDGDCVNFRFNV